MRVLAFGHPDLEEDNLALKLASTLRVPGFTFEVCRSPESLSEIGEPFIILDVGAGIQEPRFIDDLSKIRAPKMVSLHDFDLGYFLKLHEKLGDLPELKVLAIPQRGNIYEIRRKVEALLLQPKNKIFCKNLFCDK